jgi:hypothetical protein
MRGKFFQLRAIEHAQGEKLRLFQPILVFHDSLANAR